MVKHLAFLRQAFNSNFKGYPYESFSKAALSGAPRTTISVELGLPRDTNMFKLTLDYLSYIWLQDRWVLVEDACIYKYAHMRIGLNSLKGGYIGEYIGDYYRGYQGGY